MPLPTPAKAGDAVRTLEALLSELIDVEEVSRQDRKDVQELLGWLRQPGEVDCRTLIECEARHLERRVRTKAYSRRPKGRRCLLHTAQSLHEVASKL